MIKRTISNNLLLRLEAQANEADIHGNEDIADKITDVMVESSVRGDEDEYKYTSNDLKKDIGVLLWSAAMRVFDYYDKMPDARDIDSAVKQLTDDVFSVFDNLIEGDVVGKYEPKTPGEKEIEPTNENEIDENHVEWTIKPSDDELSKRTITIEDNEDEDEDEDENHDIIVEADEEIDEDELKKEKKDELEDDDEK